MGTEDLIMPFGKHQGKTLGDILASDPAYLDYLNGIDIRNPTLAAAIAEMNEKYAAEIERAIGD